MLLITPLVKKIIFISTCSNYGLVENGRLADEKYKLNPLSQYAKSKVELENYILSKKEGKLRSYHFKICDSFWFVSKNEIRSNN